MSNLAVKRIGVDMKLYHKLNLQEQGIFCHFSDENIYNVKVLIIGPKDTPYEGGFYMFNLNYPLNYPLNPPSVKFISMCRNSRIHPNLYANGKVCLSFLGTWSGPPWTSCLNLTTILLSILSLFNENPIVNEPGYENETGYKGKLFKSIVDYYNIKLYTISVLQFIQDSDNCFKSVIEHHFVQNYDNYCDRLEKHESVEYYKRNIYGNDVDVEYNYNKNALHLFKNICLNNISIQPNVEEEVEVIDEPPKPKMIRKAPNQKAKNYENDYVLVSENDNRLYKVITTKSGYKRWVLKK